MIGVTCFQIVCFSFVGWYISTWDLDLDWYIKWLSWYNTYLTQVQGLCTKLWIKIFVLGFMAKRLNLAGCTVKFSLLNWPIKVHIQTERCNYVFFYVHHMVSCDLCLWMQCYTIKASCLSFFLFLSSSPPFFLFCTWLCFVNVGYPSCKISSIPFQQHVHTRSLF